MFAENYLAFLDETGDHSLQHIDRQYPIFALGAIFCSTQSYIREINPIFDELKYKYWNKRHIILHSTDIRSSRGDFSILRNSNTRNSFVDDINNAILKSPFDLVISAVNKVHHNFQYVDPTNPYTLTLEFVMERAYYLVGRPNGNSKTCLFIAESRNDDENEKLLKVFHRIKRNGTRFVSSSDLKFITDLIFVKKQENETGHQIADLCLYPTAKTLLSQNIYPSFPIVYKKFYKNNQGSPNGYGLKFFPSGISRELLDAMRSASDAIDITI